MKFPQLSTSCGSPMIFYTSTKRFSSLIQLAFFRWGFYGMPCFPSQSSVSLGIWEGWESTGPGLPMCRAEGSSLVLQSPRHQSTAGSWDPIGSIYMLSPMDTEPPSFPPGWRVLEPSRCPPASGPEVSWLCLSSCTGYDHQAAPLTQWTTVIISWGYYWTPAFLFQRSWSKEKFSCFQ